ncbi:MAG: ABC transporter ATP-binding protein [Acidobacteria bacterium]|nr:ABC transporter ATP-binding protein [Acidobacteriota bacterium]
MKQAVRMLIECEGISKNFGQNTILRDISFRLMPGEIMAVVGPNGAGKTTLLKIIGTLVYPTAGDVRVAGHSIRQAPARVRQAIGYVSAEERSFYWRLNGIQNLRFFAALHGLNGPAQDERIRFLLHAVGLAEGGKERIRNYSSGMKQMLGIARGLLHDPLVVLMDEPTRSLSPELARKIRIMIKNMAVEGRKSIVLSSHNLAEVEGLADRILLLDHGVIKGCGTMAELRQAAALDAQASLDDVFHHHIRMEE